MGTWYKNENILAARDALDRAINQLECAADSTMQVVMSESATVYLACCALLNATHGTKTSKFETYKRVMRGLKTIGTLGTAKASAIGCGDWEIMYDLLSLKTAGIVCLTHERPYIDVLLRGHMSEACRALSKYYDINKDYCIFDPYDAEYLSQVADARWEF